MVSMSLTRADAPLKLWMGIRKIKLLAEKTAN
jgi:hypothetical protein